MQIRQATPHDHPALQELWLRSVQATHTFLTNKDIERLYPLVRDHALPALELWLITADSGEIMGFMGLDGNKLEAIFLDPPFFRQGAGKHLLKHAEQLKGYLTVDVNEQNPEAIQFYLANGFRITGRSPLDGQGNPFPLIHLSQHPDDGQDDDIARKFIW